LFNGASEEAAIRWDAILNKKMPSMPIAHKGIGPSVTPGDAAPAALIEMTPDVYNALVFQASPAGSVGSAIVPNVPVTELADRI